MANTSRFETVLGTDYAGLLEIHMVEFNSPENDRNANTIRQRMDFRDALRAKGWDLQNRRSFLESAIRKVDKEIENMKIPWLKRDFKI
jgi:hypothetical protein